jgi:hypothetical protein
VVISAAMGASEQWQFSVLGVREFLDKSGGLPALVDCVTRVATDCGLRAPEAQSGSA